MHAAANLAALKITVTVEVDEAQVSQELEKAAHDLAAAIQIVDDKVADKNNQKTQPEITP